MHIALINQFYPPAGAPTGKLLRDLACALRDAGHAVSVITSAGLYGTESGGPHPDEPGIHVRRVGSVNTHHSGLAAKFIAYARFFPRASAALKSLTPQPDVILCLTTPPFCGWVARRYGQKRGIPYVLWCMDLYPEALRANAMLRPHNPVYRMSCWAARKEREDAWCVISLGPDMSDRIRAMAPAARVAEVPVWSPLVVTPEQEERARALRRERGWRDDEVVLLYSGHIGRAHRVDEFVALAEHIAENRLPLRMVFSGTGPMQREWKARLGGYATWLEPVDDAGTVAHLLSADIHLISQQPAWAGVVVPSKYQAACALGRPVVFAGDRKSAVARWIQEADSGWIIEPDRLQAGINDALLQLGDPVCRNRKGGHACAQSAGPFDADRAKRRLVSLMEEAVGHAS